MEQEGRQLYRLRPGAIALVSSSLKAFIDAEGEE
jgi:hypothetical protein